MMSDIVFHRAFNVDGAVAQQKWDKSSNMKRGRLFFVVDVLFFVLAVKYDEADILLSTDEKYLLLKQSIKKEF